MKREVLKFKVERQKRRTDFLFNDGEFKPRSEKSAKTYKRRGKYQSIAEYENRFYL